MFKNELILEKGGKFITRFGSTMNMERPNVVYLRTKSKITPLTEKKEYDKWHSEHEMSERNRKCGNQYEFVSTSQDSCYCFII